VKAGYWAIFDGIEAESGSIAKAEARGSLALSASFT